MITLDLGRLEYFDNQTNEFVYDDGGIVRFEYSLKTLYIWEGKWGKPFLKGGHNEVETLDFYKLMALDPIQDKFMTSEVIKQLTEYIHNPNSATTFASANVEGSKVVNLRPKVYTSEEIYALMIASRIPLEFEERNLNRLLIILRIIGSYNSPPKKMSKQDIFKQNKSLNQQRKEQLKTKG